jgi:hypothetical protein
VIHLIELKKSPSQNIHNVMKISTGFPTLSTQIAIAFIHTIYPETNIRTAHRFVDRGVRQLPLNGSLYDQATLCVADSHPAGNLCLGAEAPRAQFRIVRQHTHA